MKIWVSYEKLRRQETNNLRQKIRIDEDGEIIKNKDQIRAKNISKSVEFYS